MVDPDEGSSLSYIPTTLVSGVTCANISPEDVYPKIACWHSAVICSVPNLPLDVMEGFLRRIWKPYSIDKICLARHGLFLVRFHNLGDQQVVVEKGIFFFFDKKPLLVKPWNPELDLKIVSLTSLPVWVQLHDLDLKYWGLGSLSKLGSTLGIPIKMDKYTMDKRVSVRVPVSYEWKPVKCTHCHLFGHLENECRRKNKTKLVWQPIKPPMTAPNLPDQAEKDVGKQVDTDGFTPVTKRSSPCPSPMVRSSTAVSLASQQLIHNQFDILTQQAPEHSTL
ncbi:hypothetical protein Cgig2_017471 [Carnegiea gigantea]|uniref:DUF4283 domain-containing protein n=1 Tax=Carnegiea gigantea TaxID=171969 RepID=A0A9Q1JGL2_9CARY|nr:hypothetical protein Cgig2_017471 [Carnegiea gigantea]